MQVIGLRFGVDSAIPSPVVKDPGTSLYSYVGEGSRRVSNVEVLDRQSGEYEEIELSRQYTLATLDYLILEQGGAGILGCVEPESTYWGADIEILRHYLETDLGKTVGAEYGEPQGRIKINNNLQLWE